MCFSAARLSSAWPVPWSLPWSSLALKGCCFSTGSSVCWNDSAALSLPWASPPSDNSSSVLVQQKAKRREKLHNYGCVNCSSYSHHLPTMSSRVGRDERDVLVPPGAEAENGTPLGCIIGAFHIRMVIAFMIGNFTVFNSLKHVNTHKCRGSIFEMLIVNCAWLQVCSSSVGHPLHLPASLSPSCACFHNVHNTHVFQAST